MAQVAIAWTLRQGGGTMPILGLDTTDRVDQAVEALNVGLTEEEIKYMGEPYLPKKVAGWWLVTGTQLKVVVVTV
jgi:versiconal hemiacetal acetate reductase